MVFGETARTHFLTALLLPSSFSTRSRVCHRSRSGGSAEAGDGLKRRYTSSGAARSAEGLVKTAFPLAVMLWERFACGLGTQPLRNAHARRTIYPFKKRRALSFVRSTNGQKRRQSIQGRDHENLTTDHPSDFTDRGLQSAGVHLPHAPGSSQPALHKSLFAFDKDSSVYGSRCFLQLCGPWGRRWRRIVRSQCLCCHVIVVTSSAQSPFIPARTRLHLVVHLQREPRMCQVPPQGTWSELASSTPTRGIDSVKGSVRGRDGKRCILNLLGHSKDTCFDNHACILQEVLVLVRVT